MKVQNTAFDFAPFSRTAVRRPDLDAVRSGADLLMAVRLWDRDPFHSSKPAAANGVTAPPPILSYRLQ